MDAGRDSAAETVASFAANDAQASDKSTHGDIVSTLKVVLLTEDRVSKGDLRELVDPCSDIAFAMALHAAREQLREDQKIEFIPGRPGELVRANERQKVTRGMHFAHTATLKRRRSVAVFNAVDPSGLSDDDKSRFEMARDKATHLLAMEQAVARRRAPMPKT